MPVPAHVSPSLVSINDTLECVARATQVQRQPPTIVHRESFTASGQGNDESAREPAAPPAERRITRGRQVGLSTRDGSNVGPNVPLPTTESNNPPMEGVSRQDATSHPKKRRSKSKRNLTASALRLRTYGESGRLLAESAQDVQEATTENHAETDRQDGQLQNQSSQAKPRRPRKRALQDAAAEIVEDAVQGVAKDQRKRGRKSKRAGTPEDAENIKIAPSETKMGELCCDGRIGRKSVRERELREMDRAAYVKKKQRELQEVVGQAVFPNGGGSVEPASSRERPEGHQREQEEEVALNVPNTIIVNGQIQIDEESLQIDRHAAAAAVRNMEELEPIDENDLSRKVTSGSWLKRDHSGGWNEILLDRFYLGLRMFGTDFEMISKMFPGKTRHAIKLKFCKEERLDYPRIKAALTGEKVPVVLEEYEKLTGTEYEDPEELDRLMEEDRKKLEEEQAAEKQAMDDAAREREVQAAKEREAAREETGKDYQQKQKKKSVKYGKGKHRGRKAREKQPGLGGRSRGPGEKRRYSCQRLLEVPCSHKARPP